MLCCRRANVPWQLNPVLFVYVCVFSGLSAEDCPLYRAHGQTELALLQRGAPLLKLRLCLSLEGRWIKLLSYSLSPKLCVWVFHNPFGCGALCWYDVMGLLTFLFQPNCMNGFGGRHVIIVFSTAWSRINCNTKPGEIIMSHIVKHIWNFNVFVWQERPLQFD